MALIIVSLAGTLLFIGASSPYTHANLNAAYDDAYVRTQQIVVGPPEPFAGMSRPVTGGGDAVMRGASLFVTEGCASCHGLGAQGGTVAIANAGVDAQLLVQRVRQGTTTGMPLYSQGSLPDDDLALILTYLRSLPPVK